MMQPIRVLITDDNQAIVSLLAMLLSEDADISVVGTAMNGADTLVKLSTVQTDVLILDIEMPVMDGIETLAAIKAQYPDIRVIMFSAHTQRGAAQTMRALARGASDYVTKPAGGGLSEARHTVRSELIPKIKALASHKKPKQTQPTPQPVSVVDKASRPAATTGVLVIAASTGGPQALSTILGSIPADFRIPILVVQHMPATFTKMLAQRLARSCAIDVVEASDGDFIESGITYIAPGDYHMELSRTDEQTKLTLHQGPPVNFCRPAADRLFMSAANVFGAQVLSVVLTGMGQDGLRGCQAISRAGGTVLAQDESSSIVWGMPGAIAQAGLADQIVPLDELANEIINRVWSHSWINQGAAG